MKKSVSTLSVLLLLTALFACSNTKKNDSSPVPQDVDRGDPKVIPRIHAIVPTRESEGPKQLPKNKVLSESQKNYDVQAIRIHLRVDPEQEKISGYVDLTLTILDKTESVEEFDLIDAYEVSKVSLLGSMPEDKVPFEQRQNKIFVEKELEPGSTSTFRIYYAGEPPKSERPPWQTGFNWDHTPNGKPWIGVNTESSGAQVWIPCKDDPSDEAEKVRLEITVPDGLVVASNGLFQGIQPNTEGTWDTHIWETHYPINNYNITFHVGDYEKHELKSKGVESFPIVFYALREDAPAQPYYSELVEDLRTYAQKVDDFMSYAQTYAGFLEEKFGLFPFRKEKMGFAHAYAVGMEHQTIISYGANFVLLDGFDPTLLHEMAHEWWGNQITAKKWEDIWIHEGFATYAEALFVEKLHGKTGYQGYMTNEVARRIRPSVPVVVPNVSAQFVTDNPNVYTKGAWTLHTLRYLIGDEVFFKILKGFATRYMSPLDNLVTTKDFIDFAQKQTRQDLKRFFEVYLYEKDFPKLEVVQKGSQLELTWLTPRFDIPVEVALTGASAKVVKATFQKGKSLVDLGSATGFVIDPNHWLLLAR